PSCPSDFWVDSSRPRREHDRRGHVASTTVAATSRATAAAVSDAGQTSERAHVGKRERSRRGSLAP
ncbi:MAG TPA: hypothetical protein VKP30_23520, partial [Polyangiaceae bacterium]|nr:hypothetical protein [Polyangiaceae bacterium]